MSIMVLPSSSSGTNQEFSIFVTARPADDVRRDYNNINESRRRFINFSTNVQLNYYPLDRASSSSSCTKKLFGSNDRLRDFRCPYDQVALDDGEPSSLSWHVISEALSLMDLPFPLEETQLNWAGEGEGEAEEEETPLQNKDDLVRHIAEFARSLETSPCNANKKNLGLRLLIEKRVFLPNDEFEAMEAVRHARQRELEERRLQRWVSSLVNTIFRDGNWESSLEFQIKRNVESSVRRRRRRRRGDGVGDAADYDDDDESYQINLTRSLINQARWELGHPEDYYFRSEPVPARVSSLVEALEKVVIDSSHTTNRCTICLNKFVISSSTEEQVVCRLPCSHIYHTDCIQLWLCRSPKTNCPLCRFEMH